MNQQVPMIVFTANPETKTNINTMETNPIDILTKKPTRRPEDLPPIPYDPRLDLQILQDL